MNSKAFDCSAIIDPHLREPGPILAKGSLNSRNIKLHSSALFFDRGTWCLCSKKQVQ